MKIFEENIKKCEEIILEAAELETGKYLKENVLIVRNGDGGWVIGLIEENEDHSECIQCYEFETNEDTGKATFLRYEPMERSHMNWAFSVAKNI